MKIKINPIKNIARHTQHPRVKKGATLVKNAAVAYSDLKSMQKYGVPSKDLLTLFINSMAHHLNHARKMFLATKNRPLKEDLIDKAIKAICD